MSVQRFFIDDLPVEQEVLHDLKWPRILINPTGEVLSVAMAKRIMRLLQDGMSYESIPEKFFEEWDREIDADTVEAVYELDFEPTDLPVPNGEHLVYPEYPAIDHPDFVRGTIVPSGIYWEIINLRSTGENFIAQYVSHRWGFVVSEHVITSILDRWQEQLPTDENGRPIEPTGTARPLHPGRLLVDLPTRLSEAQDGRSSFSIQPPMYSPRPTWRGVTFRHPREVAGSEDLDVPPFARPGAEFNGLPGYSPGESAPGYVDLAVAEATRALLEATTALTQATEALTKNPGAPTDATAAPTEATAALVEATTALTGAITALTEAARSPSEATGALIEATATLTGATATATRATAVLTEATRATGTPTEVAETTEATQAVEATAATEATVIPQAIAATEATTATEATAATEAIAATVIPQATEATEVIAAAEAIEAVEATEVPEAIEEPPSSPRRQVPREPKHPTWPICPAVLSGRFTGDDIVEYLFDGMHAGTYTYGNGPHAPSAVRPPQPQNGRMRIHRILMSAAEDRETANESSTLVWRVVDEEEPTPWDFIDEQMREDVRQLFTLLQNHEAFEPVRILYDNNLTPSGNARELVNHLRERRGFPRVEFQRDSSALVADILELLQWVRDPFVMQSLNEYVRDFPWTFKSLHNLLEEVTLRVLLDRQTRNRPYQINLELGGNAGDDEDDDDNDNDEDDYDEPDGFHINAMEVDGAVDEPDPPLNHAVVDQPAVGGEHSQSRRLASALSLQEYANTDVPVARIARHERIFHRLAEWLTLLTDLRENRDAGEEIAEKLREYEFGIQNLKAHPAYQPRLWSLGHQCEVMLAELEIQTFVRMFSVDPDGTLQWEARFSEWTTQWAKSFVANVHELFADHHCLNSGIFRTMHILPQALEVRPVVTHPNVVQDVRYVTDLWTGFVLGPLWSRLRHHFDSLVQGDNVGPIPLPTIMMEMRHKFIVALLTLDSCVLIRDPGFQFGNPNYPLNWDDGSPRPSGFDWNLGADVAPTPADGTDQLPNRAINMGVGRSHIYESAMERAEVAQRIVHLVTPQQNVDTWLDHVNAARDHGDQDMEGIDMSAEDAPGLALQLHIPPPPPRAALPDLLDADGDVEMGDDDDDDDLPDYDSDMFASDEMDID